jgi:hypothetical protein
MTHLTAVLLALWFVAAGFVPGILTAVEPPPPEERIALLPGEIEDWALGCSAVLAVRNDLDPYQFGMMAKGDPYSARAAAAVLSRDWGCDNRAVLLDLIARMTDGGHNVSFAKAYHELSALTEEDDEQWLQANGDKDRAWLELTKSLGDRWGDKQIKAWDWFRMMHLTAWGYIAGYIDLQESYDLMTPVIQRLRQSFSSWDEANRNYIDGYAWWSGTDITRPDTEYKLRLNLYESIRSNTLVLNPDVWVSERSALPTATRYNDLFRYEERESNTCSIIRGVGELSGTLVIPDTLDEWTVTAIEEHAFASRNALTGALILPDSITVIGGYAFSACNGLSGNLVLPEGLTAIGPSAFYLCGFNGSLTLPAGVTDIGRGAFAYCGGFTGQLVLPDGLTDVAEDVFSNCDGLDSLYISKGVASVDESAFSGCRGLAYISVSAQNSLYSSMNGMLCDQDQSEVILVPKKISIHDLTLPSGMTTIRDWAFMGCAGLTGTLTLPDSVTSLGLWAFGDCAGLTAVSLSGRLESIGRESFHGCSGLSGILTIPEGVTAIEKGAFAACGGLTGVSLPDSMTHISDYAFMNCGGITEIWLPAGIQTLGDWAFMGGGCLAQAVFCGDAPVSFGNDVFKDCAPGFRILYPPQSTGWNTPEWNGYRCYSSADPDRLSEINTDYDFIISDNGDGSCEIIGYRGVQGGDLTIPDTITGLNVVAIAESAFRYRKEFTGTLTLPDSVTRIGGRAFEYSGLTHAVLGKGVESIGQNALNASGLIHIDVSAQNECFIAVNGILFSADQSVLVLAPLGYQADHYVIPDGTQTIGTCAFRSCKGFTGSLHIPDSVTAIESQAFKGCGITGLSIPDSVAFIGEQAFNGCNGLTGITLGTSVTHIGDHAFSHCKLLSLAAFLGDAPESFGDHVFDGCAPDFKLSFSPEQTGWQTPVWHEYPAFPVERFPEKP